MKAGLFFLSWVFVVLAGCTSVPPEDVASPPVTESSEKSVSQADEVPGSSDHACPLPPPCTLAEPVECPPPKVIEKVIVKTEPPKTGGELNLPIIGEVENVLVEPPGIVLEARIDTGAESSSIHAHNIQVVERDGTEYVRFSVRDPKSNKLLDLERKLHRTVRIKQGGDEYDRRYVVKLWLSLGDIRESVDVTLADREGFEFELLVGRNLLTDTAIVDVSRKHTLK